MAEYLHLESSSIVYVSNDYLTIHEKKVVVTMEISMMALLQ